MGIDNGLLASLLRKHPHSLVLFDEFEKSPDIHRILLEVLDRGTITNNDGTQLQAGNSLFVMTTNLASDTIQKFCQANPGPLSEEKLEELKTLILNELMGRFPPEFLNRLDGIIPFLPLTEEACHTITKGLLNDFAQQAYREKKLEVVFTPEIIDYCAKRGFDPKFGARPLKRLIKSLVRILVANVLQYNTIKEGDSVKLTVKEGKPTLLKIE